MNRRTHGFGVVDVEGVLTQFDSSSGYNSFFTAQLLPGPPGPGAGNAIFNWFQTFGLPTITDIFDPQTRWVVGMDCRQYYADVAFGLGPPQQNQVLVGSDATGGLIGVRFEASGVISVQDLINNVQICATTTTYPIAAWPPYIELRTDGWGTLVNVELWIGDVKKAFGSATLSGKIADRWSFTAGAVPQGFGGAMFANIYINDGQGVAPWNDRLGPVRITTFSPVKDASGRWAITPGTNASAYLSVNDLLNGSPGGDPNGSPDGDFSYLTPNAFGSAEFFIVGGQPCYGLILGVNVCVCFRGTTGSAGLEALLLQNSAVHNLGVLNVSGGYHTEQQFVGTSFSSGLYFTDGEISGSYWGFLTNSSLDLRVTQIYLEKIVSLRNVAFGCGGGSYSFGG